MVKDQIGYSDSLSIRTPGYAMETMKARKAWTYILQVEIAQMPGQIIIHSIISKCN